MIGKDVSHYKILEHLGTGGMGVVYKARDLKLDRLVAMKFLAPGLTSNDPSARERLIREAKAASALQHNNICAIHAIEQTSDEQTFICMDFYEGETLKSKQERGRLNHQEALAIAGQLALGLREAHQHGVIHRDVKPANIFITNQGVVKILDFGLAKFSDLSRISRDGLTVGTPAYMSPEQTRGEDLDQRTDIWSFGVVLYEMLTGRRPFAGDHPLAMMYSINHEEPKEPSILEPDIPVAWNSLCMRCLQKNPQDRVADLAEVSALLGVPARNSGALRRLLSGVPHNVRRGMVIPAVFIIGLMLWYLGRAKTISLESTDTVVVADIENRTDNPVFNHSLTEGLRVSLRQSGLINILSPDQVAEARELLKISPDRPFDEQTALFVAKREGARAVISANIEKLGSMYVLRCGIIDAKNGETIRTLRQEASKIEAALTALDNLSRDLREGLGESMSQISKAGLPLAEVTTPSLQALELYSQSDQLASEGRYKDAALLLEKAVAIDSQFVMAISDLAYDYRKSGMDSLATLYHSRILPLIHRATEREKLEILAIYYGPSFEMDFPKAYEQLQLLTVRYPNDAYAYATLGNFAMHAGDTQAALAANAKAVALHPQYDKTCYNNSAFALALDGQPDQALSWFRKAKALRPNYAAIDHYMALTYCMKQSWDSAVAVLRPAALPNDLASMNKSRVILSCLEYVRGNLRDAEEICLEGIRESKSSKRPSDEAYFHFLLGAFAAEKGLQRVYRTHMAMASELSVSPYFELALVGTSYAKQGLPDEAAGIIQRIIRVKSFDPFFVRRRAQMLNLVRGQLALNRKQPARARKYFEAVERVQAGDPFYLLARKGAADCAALQSDSSAAALYEFVLSRRGQVVMGNLSSIRQTGVWTRWLWPEVELDLARYYASANKFDLAGKYCEAALTCWRGADPSDRRAAEARDLFRRILTHH